MSNWNWVHITAVISRAILSIASIYLGYKVLKSQKRTFWVYIRDDIFGNSGRLTLGKRISLILAIFLGSICLLMLFFGFGVAIYLSLKNY